jgi:hypothetical protein
MTGFVDDKSIVVNDDEDIVCCMLVNIPSVVFGKEELTSGITVDGFVSDVARIEMNNVYF